ncbi:hypothetical protein JTE90_012812 [Oedothorax gibbosus]|uniref:Cuticle protein n=1 Tax=Oedothorax gibbosus TaxID=931172 RepID=A0AAV6W2N8_9ARAC|nr:hypothetical protein JTE90_012812 [Oedothorax gibbosus]
MFKVLLFATCVLLVKGQYGYPQNYNDQPNPYEFSYSSPADGGSSSHSESGDGQGRVQGSYTVTDDDGRSRTVEYVADENGYRANIVTNEPGTSNQAPADVTIQSSADQGAGSYGPAQYAPQPTQYAPQPIQYAPQPIQYAPQPIQYAPQPIQYAPQPIPYENALGYNPYRY